MKLLLALTICFLGVKSIAINASELKLSPEVLQKIKDHALSVRLITPGHIVYLEKMNARSQESKDADSVSACVDERSMVTARVTIADFKFHEDSALIKPSPTDMCLTVFFSKHYFLHVTGQDLPFFNCC